MMVLPYRGWLLALVVLSAVITLVNSSIEGVAAARKTYPQDRLKKHMQKFSIPSLTKFFMAVPPNEHAKYIKWVKNSRVVSLVVSLEKKEKLKGDDVRIYGYYL